MEVRHFWFAQVNNDVNSIRDIAQVKQTEEMTWKRRSIYKLPPSVTNLNKNAYSPQVISFGPYHCNDEILRPMEEHKDRLLCRFLRRSEKSLQFYFNLLAKEKDYLMDAYYPRWPHDENVFLSIMVRDGCCMLEILQSYTKPITELDYASNDPIFSAHGRNHLLPYLQCDMIQLENQLPMRVLEALLEQGVEAVNQLVIKFFCQESAPPLGRCEHVLDLCRKVLLGEYSAVEQHVLQIDSKDLTDSISSDLSTVEMEMKAVIPNSVLPDPSTSEVHIKMISDSIIPDPCTVAMKMPLKMVEMAKQTVSLGRPGKQIVMAKQEISLGRPNRSNQRNTRKEMQSTNQGGDSILPDPSVVEKDMTLKGTKGKISLGRLHSNLPNSSNTEKEMQSMIHRGDDENHEFIRPATELYEAGIRIQASSTGKLKDINFDSKTGTLTVPPIIVHDSTEALFLNLMAFERFHVGALNWVSAYVFFMDSIINDARDIRLLCSNNIVQNALGSDEAAAQLFNSLSKEVAIGKCDSLEEKIKKVNKYCERWWPRWRSYFLRTYWRNPWILISVIGAIVLFILTVIQTIYTMMSYEY